MTEFIGTITEIILEDTRGLLVDNLASAFYTVEDERAGDRPIPEDGYLKTEQEVLENQKNILVDQ